MHSAIIQKEIREIGWMGVIAMVMLGFTLSPLMGIDILNARIMSPQYIPFADSSFPQMLALVGGVLAAALGYWQTLGESLRKTWLYLLHRPISLKEIIAVKLATGLCLLLVMTGIPIAVYLIWAIMPGTHASPFELWFTTEECRLWLMTPSIYFAAFLSGLREARWFGSRLLALPGPVFLISFVAMSGEWAWTMFAINLVTCVLLVAAIFEVAREEDFS